MIRAPQAARGLAAAVTLLAVGLWAWRDPRPDVVLIVLDTVRADHVSAYGYPRPTTPRIDALAAEGVLYRTAIAPGTWTVPSHASLFTGLLPSAHGAVRAPGGPGAAYALRPDAETLAGRLAAAGYDTAAFAANDAYLAPVFELNRGFRRYDTEGLRPGARLVARVSRWLRRHAGRPAFLFVNFIDAHEPHAAPPPYDRLFPGGRDDVDDVVMRFHATHQLPTAAERAHTIAQYDGEIRYLDDQVGALLDLLAQTGRYDDALVIVTADHGQLFGEHGVLGHGGAPYHDLVRVPLIVRFPRARRRGVVGEPVSLIDVAPTVLDVLGLAPLRGAAGHPLGTAGGPIIAEEIGADGAIDRAVYARDGHVLLESLRPEQRTLTLFDSGADPAQLHPLPATDPAQAALDEALARHLATLPPARHGATSPPDRAFVERLRALGYVR